MPDDRRSNRSVDSYHVETHVRHAAQCPGTSPEPPLRETGHLLALAEAYGVLRRAEGRSAPRLDLDECKNRTATGDEVELSAADAHVASEKDPSGLREMAGGERLGRTAELLAFVHTTSVAALHVASYGVNTRSKVTLAMPIRQADVPHTQAADVPRYPPRHARPESRCVRRGCVAGRGRAELRLPKA
jgi:hypothetical protein